LQTFFGQVKDTGAFTSLQSAAQSVGGGLQSLWTGIMAVVNAMTGGQPAGTAFGNALNTVATAAQTVGGWLKTAGNWISQNLDLVTPLVAAIGGAVAAVTAVTTAMQVAAVAQAVLNAVMAANPIMLVITLIAALTAVLTYFFTCTNTGRAVWSSFTSFLGSCVQGITGFFSGLGSTIVASSARRRTVLGTRGTAWSAGSEACRAPLAVSSPTPAASSSTQAQASSTASGTASKAPGTT
jgi:hypothetical protein